MSSYSILRRLAHRAVPVLGRHRDESPYIAALEASVLETTSSFIEAYDLLAATPPDPEELGVDLEALLQTLKRWVNVVAHHVPTVHRSDFGEQPKVAIEVVTDAERLIDLVDQYEARHGALAFSATMRASLQERIEAAKGGRGDLDSTLAQRAKATRELKEKAERARKAIQVLRRALIFEIGRGHPDVRMLQAASRRGGKEEDDPPIDDEPSSPAEAVGNDAAPQ